MRQNTLYHLVLLLLTILLVGCNGKPQNQSQSQVLKDSLQVITTDYSGVYKSNKIGVSCNLTITLIKETEGYKYLLTGEHYDQEGKALIEKADAVYLTFNGPVGNNKPNTVSGQIEENSILIQNYGNSMNEYHHFVECDEKYLEFVKQ